MIKQYMNTSMQSVLTKKVLTSLNTIRRKFMVEKLIPFCMPHLLSCSNFYLFQKLAQKCPRHVPESPETKVNSSDLY